MRQEINPYSFFLCVIIFFSSIFIILFNPTKANSQTPEFPTTLSIYDSIKAQEANFPLPSTNATFNVGNLDLSILTFNFDKDMPYYIDSALSYSTYPGPEDVPRPVKGQVGVISPRRSLHRVDYKGGKLS